MAVAENGNKQKTVCNLFSHHLCRQPGNKLKALPPDVLLEMYGVEAGIVKPRISDLEMSKTKKRHRVVETQKKNHPPLPNAPFLPIWNLRSPDVGISKIKPPSPNNSMLLSCVTSNNFILLFSLLNP